MMLFPPPAAGVAVAVGAALALAACAPKSAPRVIAAGDPGRGAALVRDTGCAACHVIPGVRGPKGQVGPSLEGFAARGLIGGRLGNEPETLAAFIRNAPAVAPGSAMPPMPLSEAQSRDIAAYLYTLDPR